MVPIETKQQTTSASMEQSLQQAVACHQAGDLTEAHRLYSAILQVLPNHTEINYNMGVLAVQEKRPADSLPFFTTALDADPTQGRFWLSYIDALSQAGQTETAKQILALARQQGLQGEQTDALAAYLESDAQDIKTDSITSESFKTAKKKPSEQELATMVALYNAGRYAEAADLARIMTVKYPSCGEGWKMLGVVYSQLGRDSDALVPMQKAAELLPKDAQAQNNLGITQQALGKLNEALSSFKRALKIEPKFVEAHSNMGTLLQAQDKAEEAEACYRRALKLAPGDAETHNRLGHLLKITGRLDEAQANFQQALKYRPGFAEAHNNLGGVLKLANRIDDAERHFRQAILIKADLPEAHSNLGGILYELGHLDEAEACWRKALAIKPDLAEAHCNLLFSLIQNTHLDAAALFKEHCRFGQRFESLLASTSVKHDHSKIADRCLRVGIVSGDLRDHAIAYFIEPVLGSLASSKQLSLHAYSNHNINDHTTQRIRQYFSQWNAVAGMNDDVLANKIRSDHIDILIDLSGHTAKNRLVTFAKKPAPLQVSWMGYPCTTGMRAMDYYFSDRHILPSGLLDDQFTEQIVRLPANAPFLPSTEASPVQPLPALNNGYVTFGSFNRLSKLNPSVISLWAELMCALPDSRMVLGAMPEEGKYDALIDWFECKGVNRERLHFHPRSDMGSYLNLHHQIDICLDTFPYNGGTTSLHALWMGVPTLTLAGDTAAGRSGAGILGHVGLEAFIAHNEADFVKKGVYWSENLDELSTIRAELRARLADSSVGHPEWIAAGVEHALRIMWERWCDGLPPASFEVTQLEAIDAIKREGK